MKDIRTFFERKGREVKSPNSQANLQLKSTHAEHRRNKVRRSRTQSMQLRKGTVSAIVNQLESVNKRQCGQLDRSFK